MKKHLSEIQALFKAQRRRDVFVYLVFVAIAAIFWLMLTLNNEVQESYNVSIRVVNMPDSATLINDFPPHIKVNLKDRGSTLLKYSLGSRPTIDVDFNKYSTTGGAIRVTASDLRNILHKTFGNSGDIIAISPDSLYSRYTYMPGKLVPVINNIDAKANFRYVINGKITLSHDSVYVYSTRNILNKINSVTTAKVEERDLRDTTTITVALVCPHDVKISPSSIEATIPVEPLITKTIIAPIVAADVPHGISIVTFPPKVEIKYLVPSSLFKAEQNFKAEIHYGDISKNTLKLPIYVVDSDWEYSDITLSTDSVEYIVETN